MVTLVHIGYIKDYLKNWSRQTRMLTLPMISAVPTTLLKQITLLILYSFLTLDYLKLSLFAVNETANCFI